MEEVVTIGYVALDDSDWVREAVSSGMVVPVSVSGLAPSNVTFPAIAGAPVGIGAGILVPDPRWVSIEAVVTSSDGE